jgi:glycine hydroxymethyltransferase
MLIDLRKSHPNLTGRDAQLALEKVNITTNRNTVPNESRSPFQASGLRLGTAAVTSRGMKELEMQQIARMIKITLDNLLDDALLNSVRDEVVALCAKFPLPYR